MSDPEGILASPYRIIERRTSKEDIETIIQIIKRENVGKVIIGLPRSLSGGLSEQTRKVEFFVVALKNYIKVPVEMRDERLSTVEANRLIRESGGSRKKREIYDDAFAAAVILQDYLDEIRDKSPLP